MKVGLLRRSRRWVAGFKRGDMTLEDEERLEPAERATIPELVVKIMLCN